MLIKCVCSNCGHSYLSEDELGDLACPRCDVVNEGHRNASDIPNVERLPNMERGFEPGSMAGPDGDFNLDHGDEAFFEDAPRRFQAKAPPPMFVTRARLTRGTIFGSLAALTAAAVLGAAMAAISIDAPVIAAVVIAIVGGAACRSGFGGRSAPQTKTRAVVACGFIVVFGFAGLSAGTWVVERFAGSRAKQTQADLDEGIKGLSAQYADMQDAGAAILLKRRIDDARRLRELSDSEIEDYLWTQQAQINQPLLAHAKLRMTAAPIIKLGPDADTISVPKEATLGIRLAEILAALVLMARAVMPRRV